MNLVFDYFSIINFLKVLLFKLLS